MPKQDIFLLKTEIQQLKQQIQDQRTDYLARIEALEKDAQTALHVTPFSPLQITSRYQDTSQLQQKSDSEDGIIKLNVGGHYFTTTVSTLTRYRESMLGMMFGGRYGVKINTDGSCFIDRDGTQFRHILNYLRDGELVAPPADFNSRRELAQEAKYYLLDGLVYQLGSYSMKTFSGKKKGSVECLQMEGQIVVAGTNRGTICVWDKSSLQLVRKLKGHSSSICCMMFEANSTTRGSRIRFSSSTSLHSLPSFTSTISYNSQSSPTPIKKSSPAPLVTGSYDKTLRVWDVATGECKHLLEGHTGSVFCLQVEGGIIVSGSWDQTLRAWDLHSGVCLQTFVGHKDRVCCVAFDGNNVIVSGSWDKTVRVWDLTKGVCLHLLTGHQQAIDCLQFEGNTVVSGGDDIRVWDLVAGKCVHVLEGPPKTAYGEDFIDENDPEDIVEKHRFPEESPQFTCCVQLAGNCVIGGFSDHNLRVWNLNASNSTQPMLTLQGHTGLIACLHVTPDMRCVISASWDRTIRIWDIVAGKCLRVLEGHQDAVLCMQTASHAIVSGSRDQSLRFWKFD
eukprot:TRINITY_DN5985_c0_g1_i1.p1 TRINITY_DN5985_c0_g1~~TRINITY_DN5985_c0_g1_i1.p1  ORF type:complete len:562 (+),score=108.68 TRINITY_DN5985_c0_g1_i1:88-1773(+)